MLVNWLFKYNNFKMEMEMDMESQNSNSGFEVRNPSRSDSIVSESTYKYIGSDSVSSQQKSA
jgi:hypothetical protein